MIAQQVPPAELLSQGALEYPCVCEFEVMAAESVVLFEKADRELQPERLVELPWEPVNAFFIDYARTLGRAWFEGQEE